MSSSYRIGTGVSRRWDGDFCWEQPRPTPWLGPPWKEESRLLLPGHWRHLSEQTRLHPAERHRHLNPVPFEAAAEMEVDLAEDVRRAGYTVTGGH